MVYGDVDGLSWWLYREAGYEGVHYNAITVSLISPHSFLQPADPVLQF